MLATNLNYDVVTLGLGDIVPSGIAGSIGKVGQVFDSGSSLQGGNVVFESVGSGAFVIG